MGGVFPPWGGSFPGWGAMRCRYHSWLRCSACSISCASGRTNAAHVSQSGCTTSSMKHTWGGQRSRVTSGGGQGSRGEEGVTVGLGVGGQWVVGAGMGVVVSVPPVDVETQRRHLGDPTPPPPHPQP